VLFSRKQEKEKELDVLIGALDTKKKCYEEMIQSMNPDDLSHYLKLKESNSQITAVSLSIKLFGFVVVYTSFQSIRIMYAYIHIQLSILNIV